jgi:protein TonB
MDTMLDRGEQLERTPPSEPLMAPAAGSLLLHAGLAAGLLAYGLLGGLFHHNQWGSAGMGGAIQVNLTSSLPLPSDQPLNQNVLATDTPSQAPAEAAPKTKEAVDETALPISDKQKKIEEQNARKARLQQAAQENRAQYGEQSGSSMARAMQPQGFTSGQTTVSDSNFGSRFGWYVDGMNRKMAASSFRQEVDPHTPHGARAYIQFAIHRDGTPSGVQLGQTSGSPTLDRACIRAAQRVDTFGALPSGYNQSTVMTSYYCEF